MGGVWSCNADEFLWNLAPQPQASFAIAGTLLNKNGPDLSPLPTFLGWYSTWLHQCLSDLGEGKSLVGKFAVKLWKKD